MAMALPFLLSALAGWAAWEIAGLSSRLATNGETTVATITNKRILGDNSGARGGRTPHSIDFNIYYRFTTPSGQIKAKSDVLHQTAFDRYKIGQRVKVRYLPDEPGFHEIVGGRSKSATAWAAAGMALFFAAIGILAMYFVKVRSIKNSSL